jgi:nitric oxide reductase NorD protein
MRVWRWLGLPRRLLLKARHGVREWRARSEERRSAREPRLQLERVHRRLELLLAAVYGRPIPIAPLETPRWTGPSARALAMRHFRLGAPIASVDGERIFLPPFLAETPDVPALTRYRLIALEQAERLVRGTTEQELPKDALERDLYLLREGATIDAHIAAHHRGVADLLYLERTRALSRRPKLDAMTMTEREVEMRFRDLLAARPEALESPSPSPAASVEWARDMARTIRSLGNKYRGVPLASIWGSMRVKAVTPVSSNDLPRDDSRSLRPRVGSPESLDSAARSGESPDDGKESPKSDQRDTPSDEHSEKSAGNSSPPKQTPTGHGDSAADQQAGTTSANEAPVMMATTGERLPPAIYYDEWDSDRCAYVRRGAAVRLYESGDGNAAWLKSAIAQHAGTVRRIRHQFERLRARRSLLHRQRAGNELDIAACVNAIVDRRAGRSADDRLYIDARPARRGLAIALLVDSSGSTAVRVTETMRIIDLERVALLLAATALDALGDMYAVYAFKGRDASNVKLTVIKDFSERNGDAVQRRIAAMDPDGYTRLGAAVRHATAQLARQSAGHRLLLILSDGRPNDVDRYQGAYGVEDARQAVIEARTSGVFPYCLTIDAQAAEYLPRIFGAAGHTILQNPEQLPKALLNVVRGLIGK